MSINLPQQNRDEESEESVSIMNQINNFLLRFSRIPLKEKLFFTQHIGVMLRAGISLSSALKTLVKQTENKAFAIVINDIAIKVEKGISLTESLKSHEKVFGELFINMVESGEISGNLENVLSQLYVQMKKQNELISKIKGAMVYPLVIIFSMLLIGSFMIIFIVPKITSILKEFNVEMPLPTKVLIFISDSIVNNGLLAALSVIAFVTIFTQILRSRKGKYFFQAILLKAPIISPIIKKINLARFARTVSGLLKTDIMIIKTFQITSNVVGNLHYKKALSEMSEKIQKGGQIHEVILNYPKLFPPIVHQMISVGEQTGSLDVILEELASFYEGEVDQIMNNLPSIIEPLLILILGAGVGSMAVAIIMPMYSLGGAM